jgi:hypothetical protein
MATLHQDVWLDTHPRTRGLRLGPFREARLRALVFPQQGTALDDPEFHEFIEKLADRIEVIAYELSNEGRDGWKEGPAVLEAVQRRWGSDVPMIAVGLGEGVPLALGAADLALVRGVAALGPATPAVLLEAAGLPSHSLAAEKPLLIVASRDQSQAPLVGFEAALGAWRNAYLVGVPGEPRCVWRAPWPGVVAEWALALL